MRVPESVRFILFDLDGTLVDHDYAAHQGALAFARQTGMDGEPEEIVHRWLDIERHWFTQFELGRTTITGQRVERTRAFLSRPELTDHEALELYEVYLRAYRAHWRAYDDAAATLDTARGRGPVGIFTNGSAEMQSAKLTVAGLHRDDLILLTAPELGAPKPRPAAYQAVLRVLGLTVDRAAEVMVIGDSLANDVDGARAAGMLAVHLDRSGAGGDIDSLRELEF